MEWILAWVTVASTDISLKKPVWVCKKPIFAESCPSLGKPLNSPLSEQKSRLKTKKINKPIALFCLEILVTCQYIWFFYSCVSFKGKQTCESLLWVPAGTRGSLPTGVALGWGVQWTVGRVREMFCVCVCVRVPQQLRMDLFLSGLNGNTELSESAFPLWGPSVATAWKTTRI